MKKSILTVAMVLAVSAMSFAQSETLESKAIIVENEVTSLKYDVEKLASGTLSEKEEVMVIERVKKGTNMLLPSIFEIQNSTSNLEVLNAVSGLLEIVNSIDNDSEALLRGIDKADIRRGMAIQAVEADKKAGHVRSAAGGGTME